MSNISKHRKKFIIIIFSTLMLLRGRANFRNLSRYSRLCEKTYSRQFRKTFDFVEFNRLAASDTIPIEPQCKLRLYFKHRTAKLRGRARYSRCSVGSSTFVERNYCESDTARPGSLKRLVRVCSFVLLKIVDFQKIFVKLIFPMNIVLSNQDLRGKI